MSRRSLIDRRFILFTPYVVLGALAVIYLVVWVGLAIYLTDRLAKAGIGWQAIERSGFPVRLTLDMDAPTASSNKFHWQGEALRLTFMPWSSAHAVIDFIGPHRLSLPQGEGRLEHQGHLASAVFDTQGLVRASSEVQEPRLRFDNKILTAQSGEFHIRRQPDSQRHDVALSLKKLVIDDDTPISRIEILVDIDPDLVLSTEPLGGQIIKLQKLKLNRKAVTLTGRGRLVLEPHGHIGGRLDIGALNLEALIDMLEEFGLSNPRQRRHVMFIARLTAALGGDTTDRLNLPLTFRNKRLMIGPVDIGAAPRWRH